MSLEPCPSAVGARSHHALCMGLMLAAARTPLGPSATDHSSSSEDSEPRAVLVPAALRARVPRIELSGLAWAPPLDRYLVVVDDSVDRERDERRGAFVLALDSTGRVDSQIVSIEGVDRLDDAEAITAGPAGRYFLLTSHAPSRDGKVRKARRQLLQLHLDGRRLRSSGAVDLLRGDHGVSQLLETLGLPADSPVDLEGLTYQAGALYVGLKAPLLNDGSAVILRLSGLDDVFGSGKLAADSLSVWGKAKLSVSPIGGGATVFQGVADLSFAPDGNLYVCANSPKGSPHDGGGALWVAKIPAKTEKKTESHQVLRPRLLRRFPALKPEGIALDPTGKSLTLVFDRNTDEPLWMTWSLASHLDAGAVRRTQP